MRPKRMVAYLEPSQGEFRYRLVVKPQGVEPIARTGRSRRLALAEILIAVSILILVGGWNFPVHAHVPNACHSGGIWTGNYPPSPCTTPVEPPPVNTTTPVTGSDFGVPLISAGFLIVLGGALLFVRVLSRKTDR